MPARRLLNRERAVFRLSPNTQNPTSRAGVAFEYLEKDERGSGAESLTYVSINCAVELNAVRLAFDARAVAGLKDIAQGLGQGLFARAFGIKHDHHTVEAGAQVA